MWKKYFFIISLLPFGGFAQSWEWAKSYETPNTILVDHSQSISKDENDNLYISGFSWRPGGGGYSGMAYNWLKKFDAQGNFVWSDTIPFYTHTKNITDEKGNTYVVGNGKIVKYNSNGIQLWAVSAAIDFNDLALSDRGLVVTGYTWSYPATMGAYSITAETGIIVECDENGNILWLNQQYKYGPGAIRIAKNGVIYVQGLAFDGHDSSVVRLFDLHGNYFQGLIELKNIASFINIDSKGSIYLIAGINDRYPIIINSDTIKCFCGSSASSRALLKFDNNGNYQWHKIIKENVDVSSLIIDSEDNVYVGGNIIRTLQIDSFLLDNKGGGIYIAKFKPDGAVAWIQYSEQGNPTSQGQINQMVLNSDNDLLIAGAIIDKQIFGDITVTGTDNMYADVLIAKISQPRSVSQNEPPINPTNGLTVYPNPTGGAFSVNYQTDEATSISVIIRNELGQTILKKEYGSRSSLSETFDLSNLAKGIYFLQVNTDEAVEVKKIVIE
ncbi:MAG: T9SS type A sorting domain-containing protein [Bacteroidetes bacterium]|nr:T9SS type A sorting domain-containing protein [Bacteroidota bacterium]